jgi:hypothetical protein
MRYLLAYVRDKGHDSPLAYFRDAWTRKDAPLLDHLAAVIDHVKPHALGGTHDENNLATSCNKCNMRRNSKSAEGWAKDHPRPIVRGKYGEPEHWDGLSTIFLTLAVSFPGHLKKTEADWYLALTGKRLPRDG